MSFDGKRDRIRQELIGAQPKRAFLVEGADDKAAFRILLERFVPGWEQRWAIAEAGNKRQLQELLALEPDWVGSTYNQSSTGWRQTLVQPRLNLANEVGWAKRALGRLREASRIGARAHLSSV